MFIRNFLFSAKSNIYLAFFLVLTFTYKNIQAQPDEYEWKLAPFMAINTSSEHHNIFSYGVKVDYFASEYFSASGRIEIGDGYFRCSSNILSILFGQTGGYYYYEFGELSYFTGMAGHFPLSEDATISPELSFLDFVYISDENWLVKDPINFYYNDSDKEFYLGSSLGVNISQTINKNVDFNVFLDALYLWKREHTTLNGGFRLGIKFN